jgi:ATP-dependent DNA ligase
MPFRERFDTLTTIYELCREKRPGAAKRIELVRTRDHDWIQMYAETMRDPLLEGIVLKRADSRLVSKSDNPFWYKVKYRDIHEPTKF